MEKTTKYYIEFGYEDGSGKIYQLETRRFDTKEEALDWYHSSFVTADTWNCFIHLISIKYDENGFAFQTSCEELSGI